MLAMSPPHPHSPAVGGTAGGAGGQRWDALLATPRARRAPWPQLPLSAVIESQAGLAGPLCDLVN